MMPPDLPLPAAAWRPGDRPAIARVRVARPARPAGRWRWLLWLLSALLHLAILAAVLLLATPEPQPPAEEPQSFSMMMEPGGPKGPPDATKPSETPQPPLPTAAPAPPPAEQPPAPPPPVPLPPVVMPPELVTPPIPTTPLVPPTPAAPVPAPPADIGPAAVRLSLPQPPQPLTPPPVPVPQPGPEPAPQIAARPAGPAFPTPQDYAFNTDGSQRGQRGTGATMLVPGRAILDSPGAPPRPSSDQSSTFRIRGAQLGKDWETLLHEWWDKHAYYPAEAARVGQDGEVKIHVKLDRSGRVQLVELQTRSGSIWLDAGAQAVFRNAALPPFPPSTPENNADLDITIDYILIRR
jgi:periplasmic protein TonB